MITHVRFQTTVVLGNIETTEWAQARPGSSALTNAITARAGNPERGESKESVVFECRQPGNHHDVEVPKANIAHITRSIEVGAPTVAQDKVKK